MGSHVLLMALLWVVSLAIAVGASELLVHELTIFGGRFQLAPATLGLLIALGADSPEITSALAALLRGSPDVGVGVVLGSNIYNLAGLLGLSALLAGRVLTGRKITWDAWLNVLLTVVGIALILLPAAHIVLGAALVVSLLTYAVVLAIRERGPQLPRHAPMPIFSPWRASLLVFVGAAFIVAGSEGLVVSSLDLGPRLGIPAGVVGIFILAIATSLPNTWAAISLTRRHLPAEAIAATFTSNSINLVVGLGLPSLVTVFHVERATRYLAAPWLGLMTLAAVALVATRPGLTRGEGATLLALYAAFVALRLLLFG